MTVKSEKMWIELSLDAAMNEWITSMVTKYKGVVSAWDVVNEPMADGNSGGTSVTDDQASKETFSTGRITWAGIMP